MFNLGNVSMYGKMNRVSLGRVTSSRSEINLIRLLARCEEMISAAGQQEDWRIKQYVNKLEDLLSETSQSERKPDEDKLKEYKKKIGFVKEFIATKDLPSVTDKALANQLLNPSKTQTIPNQYVSPSGRQIKQVAASQYNSQMKKDLFAKSTNSNETNGLRQRSVVSQSRDIDEMMRHQQEQHERVAEDMISLARNLKHNISVSGKIIREDTKILQQASMKAEENVTHLKHESSRLETHLRKGTNWSLWIALAVVCATFLFMIFFIRFFPKPK